MNQSNSSWASNGFKIAPFGKGRNAIQSVHANDLVDALNMLGTITIIRGTEDKVVYADNGVTIQLKTTEAATDDSETVDVIVCSEGEEITYRLHGSIVP